MSRRNNDFSIRPFSTQIADDGRAQDRISDGGSLEKAIRSTFSGLFFLLFQIPKKMSRGIPA
jgi:hypothetical protein